MPHWFKISKLADPQDDTGDYPGVVGKYPSSLTCGVPEEFAQWNPARISRELTKRLPRSVAEVSESCRTAAVMCVFDSSYIGARTKVTVAGAVLVAASGSPAFQRLVQRQWS